MTVTTTIREEKKVSSTLLAAKNKGPGAAKYILPSTCGYLGHDITRNQGPAFSFGKKLEYGFLKTSHCSPGPVYAVDSKITKNGLEGTPMYSIQGRARPIGTFKTPGPGNYFSEKVVPLNQKTAPSYSLASRLNYARNNNNPAPNNYSLPSLLGINVPNKPSSSCYSILGRKSMVFKKDTPGSAHYTIVDQNVYKYRAPSYIIGSRVFAPGDKTTKPGPGAHYPEKVTLNRPKAPEYSQGIRHSEYVTSLITDEDLKDSDFVEINEI